jgi:UDP-N-acetylglucosamine 3-dehydrogenase
MGKNHLRVLKSIPEVKVTAIFDPHLASNTNIVDIPIVNTIEEFFSNKFDYVVIATPTNTHEEIAVRVLREGAHVFIEKPISISSASALRIIHEANLAGKEISVGHIERFNAAVIEAKQKIEAGILGNVSQIITRRIGPNPNRISDVGVTFDLCSHDIQLTMWLLGKHYKKVFAVTKSLGKASNEDMIIASGVLDDEVMFSHTVNWVSPSKERSVTILGEKGALIVDTLQCSLTFIEIGGNPVTNPQLRVQTGNTQGEARIFAFDKPEPLLTEHQGFIQLLLGKKSEVVNGISALETIKVCEAFIQSAANLEAVTL